MVLSFHDGVASVRKCTLKEAASFVTRNQHRVYRFK